jgi:hypothetical protein
MSSGPDGPHERWGDRYPVPSVYLIVVGIPVALFVTAGILYFVLFFDISMN